MRPNGISVLVACQNSARTVELCLRSFLSFGDEVIVVDNGSTDGTRDIVRQFAAEHDRVQFFDRPELPDLYQNRQFALERSRFR
ncbi:MAG TPA: glycosyltransferase, partial [Anaerolineae bacterium]|nr:glycosyltransferase [Anaerolineae bacterium]